MRVTLLVYLLAAAAHRFCGRRGVDMSAREPRGKQGHHQIPQESYYACPGMSTVGAVR